MSPGSLERSREWAAFGCLLSFCSLSSTGTDSGTLF